MTNATLVDTSRPDLDYEDTSRIPLSLYERVSEGHRIQLSQLNTVTVHVAYYETRPTVAERQGPSSISALFNPVWPAVATVLFAVLSALTTAIGPIGLTPVFLFGSLASAGIIWAELALRKELAAG